MYHREMKNKNELIRTILDEEFIMFDRVSNEGGRADCQDNRRIFNVMRASQFLAWDEPSLSSYLQDLEDAKEAGRNLLTEKYAFMMEDTDPAAYARLAQQLPAPGEKAKELIDQIMEIYMRQTEAFMKAYPAFLKRSRPLYAKESGPVTSIETYMRSELKTYSVRTLSFLAEHISAAEAKGESVVYEIYRHTAEAYGFASVEAAAERQ